VSDKTQSAASALFDLRTVIAILFGIYGIILTIMGFVADTPEELAKAGGININLWTGIAMLIVAALFVTWTVTRPLHPAAARQEDSERPPQH
jgi:Na+/melibiose symporter-like transporter